MADPVSFDINQFTGLISYLFALMLVTGLMLLGIVGLAYAVILWFKFRNREERSLNFILLEVLLPRENEIKSDAAEQMFASLYSIRKSGMKNWWNPQEHIAFEIIGKKEDIRFFISVHEKLRDLVEKQIYGAYPGAEVKEVDEYNIFSEEGKVEFASLKLSSPSFYPSKIYRDLPTDPLSSLTSVLAKMGEGEGAVIQIIVSPADKKWSKSGKAYIAKTKKNEADPEKAKYNIDPKTYDAIENKCSKVGFETTVRLVVSSASQESAKAHLDNLKSVFNQFNSDLNSWSSAKHWFKQLFMVDFIYRYQPLFGSKSVLSAEELATIYHFPNKSVETPHIHWLSANTAPAPSLIPTSGLFLGVSRYRGLKRPVYISDKDRQRHMYIIGKTGMGKSVLLTDMILQDIRAGKGVCFIDPHDTVEQILEFIPPERAEDVIYFNPSDTERPMGLNIMEEDTEEQMHFVTSAIIGLMYKLYDPHKTGIIGPRFEHAIRNAMLTVMSEPGATFVEVGGVLTDARSV